ncbi:MAG: alpha/beta hydrolase, partial [Aquaticitalea sp.]
MKQILILFLFSILISGCASKKITDISYNSTPGKNSTQPPLLNVFKPKDHSDKRFPVVIFVHGGNWNAGNKDIYGFLGRNFAKNDIVTVIPNYTLSPNADYDTMAKQLAEALRWTQTHIADYGGDAQQIYLMGHSAGGNLIALIATNPKYLEDVSAIKGVILNDAAGLDMKSYLEQFPPTSENNYDVTWTKNTAQWKDASPVYFLNEKTPPFLIYIGDKTYPSIKSQNSTFLEALHQYQPKIQPIHLNKKHVPMMSQYFFPWSKRYDEIVD